MIMDYHYLNSGTVTNAYLISNQKVLLDKLSTCDKFTNLTFAEDTIMSI